MGTRHLYWILTGPSFAVSVKTSRITGFDSEATFLYFLCKLTIYFGVDLFMYNLFFRVISIEHI
jgi:hypothetical protein